MKRLRLSLCPHGFADTNHCEDCIMSRGAIPSVFHHSSQQTYHQATIANRRRKHGLMDDEDSSGSPSSSSASFGDNGNGIGNGNCAHNAPSEHVLRYNHITPTYLPYMRVPERLYPSPQSYDWKFTGSSHSEKAEYYERDSQYGRVLLNFYYTSGTIKVLLMHHLEGEVQLFKKGRSLLPDIYRNVLQDPIGNTDVKYRRRGAQAIQY
jgi:hypothetical protein